MVEVIQPSFAKGEISPSLFGRVDTSAYAIGLALARNAIIHTYGGVSRRPGQRFIGPVKDHSYNPKLVEFQFKTTDTYVLEFGDMYMRVIRNDAYVLTGSLAITGATNADPVVVTATAHGYSNGDEVFFSGVTGMLELNGNRYVIQNSTANTFELTNQVTGVDVDGTNFGVFGGVGSVGKIYELVTPYMQGDLFTLDFTQSADVMTIVHPSYPVYELSRFDHDDWSIDQASFDPGIGFPTDIVATRNNANATNAHFYTITAIDSDTGEESLRGLEDVERVITNITSANPAVITSTAHNNDNGDILQIDNVVGMTELNGNRYVVANRTANTFELTDADGNNIDTTGFGAYVSGGITRLDYRKFNNGGATPDNTLTWTAVPGAVRYAVYRQTAGVFGLIGETVATTFDDVNITPDTSITPPRFRDPFNEAGTYPGAVGYFEQRRVFGGSLNKPDTSEFSQVGNQSNFSRSTPTQPDDSITATLASQQVNEIRHYVAQNDLIVFTSGSEWRVTSGPDNTLEPDTIQLKPQSSWGASRLQPQIAGNTIIFITDDKTNVRSLGYSLELDGYTGANLNILNQHLLLGYQLMDWAYVKVPESRFYLIRNDGVLLTMSFNPEQEVIAWSQWKTDGDYESVVSLRGGGPANEDSLYFVVKRRVNGQIVRYVELSRQFNNTPEVRDAFFVDSGLTYDFPQAITAITLGATTTITVPNHGFSNGDEVELSNIEWVSDVDDLYVQTQPDQLNFGTYVISNVTANTFDIAVDSTTFNAYVEGGNVRLLINTVLSLDHLEGRTVLGLIDGAVVEDLIVTNGRVTLPTSAARVHLGLPYVTDIETLNLETPQGTIQGRLKRISSVTLRYYQSAGLYIGPNENDLVEVAWRELEAMGEPVSLLSGDHRQVLSPSWNSKGRIFMRHSFPLPLTLLAVLPNFDVGDDV